MYINDISCLDVTWWTDDEQMMNRWWTDDEQMSMVHESIPALAQGFGAQSIALGVSADLPNCHGLGHTRQLEAGISWISPDISRSMHLYAFVCICSIHFESALCTISKDSRDVSIFQQTERRIAKSKVCRTSLLTLTCESCSPRPKPAHHGAGHCAHPWTWHSSLGKRAAMQGQFCSVSFCFVVPARVSRDKELQPRRKSWSLHFSFHPATWTWGTKPKHGHRMLNVYRIHINIMQTHW